MRLLFLMMSCTAFLSSQMFANEANPSAALFTSCAKCHGEKGEGNQEAKAPKLAGQYDWYIQTQLLAFKSGARKYKNAATCADGLSEKDITELSSYIKGL